MGEETTWFDFLPGVHGLKEIAKIHLGREWTLVAFQDTYFDLSHVFGALLVLAFVIVGGIAYSRAVGKGGDDAIVPPSKFNLRNLFEMLTDAIVGTATGVMGEKNARRYLPLVG